jgi:hypothetical protein
MERDSKYHYLGFLLRRELVLIITASVTDTGMDASDLEPCLGLVLGAFLLLGETALSSCQLLLILVEELGVAMSLSMGYSARPSKKLRKARSR